MTNSIFPIHLKALDVYRAAKAAFDAGNLQVQHTTSSANGCAYRSKRGYPCGVGAAMTDEQANSLKGLRLKGPKTTANRATIIDLVSEGLVTTDNEEMLTSLQKAHDNVLLHHWDERHLTRDDKLTRLKNVIGDGLKQLEAAENT